MVQNISRSEIAERLLSNEEFTLVDVLPPAAFDAFHLPGAINVPLDDDFDEHIQLALPDKAAPVIVYSEDRQSKASSAAARKMHRLGYRQVYDYAGGKLDWKAAGLPIAGLDIAR